MKRMGIIAAIVAGFGVAIVVTAVAVTSLSGHGSVATAAGCMEARGYSDYEELRRDPRVMSSDAFAEEFGYGISIRPVVTGDFQLPESDLGLAQLARDERECLAEYGRAGEEALQIPEVDTAYRELVIGTGAAASAATADVDEFLGTLPGMPEALEAWRTCMAGHGHDFAAPADASASIQAYLDAIAGVDYEAQIVTDERGAAALLDPLEGTPELAQLQETERTLARTDHACRTTTIDPAIVDAVAHWKETRTS